MLAGAGSGKTSMLTARIAYLVATRRAHPGEVLAVTFTNKAAGEMRERVEKHLHAEANDVLGSPEIGTFHSVCIRILRREASRLPYTQAFVIYDDSDQLSLIKTAMKRLEIDDKAFNPKSLQAAINRLKCDAVEAHELQPDPHNLFEKTLKRVYEQYQKELIGHNAIDFGEIICLTYRLLRDDKEVRARYQRRYRYVHVDEYQDTNRAQYLLLQMLTNPKSGGHGNLCVVGDEDQSIYKWRGADIKNILDFEQDLPGAAIVKLEQNYRSTQTIIRAASEVIRNNTQRKNKTLWTENPAGTPIRWFQVPDERTEAEWVVREIQRFASQDGRSFGDFSIFYRTNAQSRQFEDIFRRERIPYQIVGGLRFYDRKEIKDILSYLRIVLNPSDSVAIKRVINVPARGIGKTTLTKLEDYAGVRGEAFSIWQALVDTTRPESDEFSGATLRKLQGFASLLVRVQEFAPGKKVSEIFHKILDETRYVAELKQEGTEEALARIENLEEFDTLVQEFEEEVLGKDGTQAPPADLLAQFLERSTLVSDSDSLDAYQSSVKMMTLHSSKGLEFPVVFLVGMEEGLFPSLRDWEEATDEDIEEERRLAYVGFTRAREHLTLMSAVSRRTWGNVHFRDPSRFIREIPNELLIEQDLTRRPSSSSTGTNSAASLSFSPGFTSGGAKPNSLVGRGLDHPDYGQGRVVAVEGAGEGERLIIEFTGAYGKKEQRKFLSRYVRGLLEG